MNQPTTSQHSIFSIVQYKRLPTNKKLTITIFPNTERELRSIIKSKFEILETHKNEIHAKQRLTELRKQYNPSRKGYKHSRLANKQKSIRYSGSGNPMFGKKHSEQTKIKISASCKQQRNRLGHKNSNKHIQKYKNKRKKWTSVPKGSKIYHSPITGLQILVFPGMQPPPNFIKGRAGHIKEIYAQVMAKARREKTKLKKFNQSTTNSSTTQNT
jgi:hypothetical protein